MNLEVKSNVKGIAGRVIISAIALLVGAVTALLSQLGIVLLPLLSAILTYLFVVERGEKRIFTFVTPIAVIAIDLLFNGLFSICCITATLVAILVYFTMAKSILSKAECALAATTLVSVAIGAMLIFAAFHEVGKIDFTAALDYYKAIVAENRALFIESFENYLPADANPELVALFDPELLGALYDSYMSILISFAVILAFALVGFTFKLLVPLLNKSLIDKREFKIWRFELSPIFAYFYLALYLVGIFFSGTDTLSVAILNLTNIFMFIFAYVGFVFALFFLRRRVRSKAGAVVILVLAMLVFYTLAVNLLSFLGVFATVMLSKLRAGGEGHDDVNTK